MIPDWEAGAYSPLTNMMYMPLRNTCARMMVVDSSAARAAASAGPEALPIELYSLAVRQEIAPGTDMVGAVHAISAETGAIAWKYEQRAATASLFASGGGLVFVGDANGRFRALDDTTGESLWEVNVGSSLSGFPISYAVGGKQYVVASTGAGNPMSFLALTPELRPSVGNNIFVFALP